MSRSGALVAGPARRPAAPAQQLDAACNRSTAAMTPSRTPLGQHAGDVAADQRADDRGRRHPREQPPVHAAGPDVGDRRGAAATALTIRLAPVPAAGEEATSSVAGRRRFPSTSPTSPPASATRKHQIANRTRSTARDTERSMDGSVVRPPDEAEPAARGSARARRCAARMRPRSLDEFVGQEPPARRGLARCAPRSSRAAVLDGPLRAARDGQDDARADRRRVGRRRVRGAQRGQRRDGRGARA